MTARQGLPPKVLKVTFVNVLPRQRRLTSPEDPNKQLQKAFNLTLLIDTLSNGNKITYLLNATEDGFELLKTRHFVKEKSYSEKFQST